MSEPNNLQYDQLSEYLDPSVLHPALRQLLENRGVTDIDRFLNGTKKDMYDGSLMCGMEKAVSLIWQKIREKKPIRIIGDYDVDGVCSTYILVRGISMMADPPELVTWDIPDRLMDGYGINERLIRKASDNGVDTIVTCDNGISAYEQTKLAKELGMTVIITDHHEIPYEEADGKKRYIIPPADAVVDPKLPECKYPFDGLCGAMVAYKVVEQFLIAGGYHYNLDKLLQFGAMATVADVMDLVDENRIIVREGLKILNRTQNPGLKALIHECGLDDTELRCYHLGFAIGPCINACGRLQSAKHAVRLFLDSDSKEIEASAKRMVNLNVMRQKLTRKGTNAALSIAKKKYAADHVLVIYLPECHESVAGIVAGKVREELHKPTFILTKSRKGFAKGSGRSIDAYPMYEKLTEAKDFMLGFGGHKMAAGVSVDFKRIDDLRIFLNTHDGLTEEDFEEKITVDATIPLTMVTVQLAEQIRYLEPFGNGNQTPVFATEQMRVQSADVLGAKENFLKAVVCDDAGHSVEMVYSGAKDKVQKLKEEIKGCIISAAYMLEVNEYKGKRTVQMRFVRLLGEPERELELPITEATVAALAASDGLPDGPSDSPSDKAAGGLSDRTAAGPVAGAADESSDVEAAEAQETYMQSVAALFGGASTVP